MTTTTTPITAGGIETINLVCVGSVQQDKAVEFYVETLGFEKRVDVPFGGGLRWIEVYPPTGNTGIALAPPPGEHQPQNTGIALRTRDIEATHAHLQAAGADVDEQIFRSEPPVPPLFWFRDPDGNTLMVVEEKN